MKIQTHLEKAVRSAVPVKQQPKLAGVVLDAIFAGAGLKEITDCFENIKNGGTDGKAGKDQSNKKAG